jgi:Skp family chaperone for outer membrane proteins
MYEKLQKEQSTMSPEQLQEMSAKLQSKQGDIQHIEKKLVGAQQALVEEILKSSMPKYRQALESIINNKEIGLLLPSETTIYASPDYDITAEVTELMNTL